MLSFNRSKLSHQQALLDQLDRERMENSELKRKVTKLETELSSYLGNEHDMTDENIRMRNQVELLREELKVRENIVKVVRMSYNNADMLN